MSKNRVDELNYKALMNLATAEELAELEQLKHKLAKNREYQQKHRKKYRYQENYENERVQYNVMLSKVTKFHLEDLAKFFGKTQRELIEELINAKFEEHAKEILLSK